MKSSRGNKIVEMRSPKPKKALKLRQAHLTLTLPDAQSLALPSCGSDASSVSNRSSIPAHLTAEALRPNQLQIFSTMTSNDSSRGSRELSRRIGTGQ